MPLGFEQELARLRRLLEDAHRASLANNLGHNELDDEDRVDGHSNPDPGMDEGDEVEEEGSQTGLSFVESFHNVTSIPRDFDKARKQPRAISVVSTVVVHQTAVEGGFGVSAKLLERTGDLALARQMRYRDTPYHGIYSPQDRTSVVQWPAWAYTYHGHKSNAYALGWAYDGLLPGDELDVEGAQTALRHFVTAMRGVGVKLKYVEAHRQHSSQRAGDPGPEIWSQIVRPLLKELKLAERPTRTTGSGKALPKRWRS